MNRYTEPSSTLGWDFSIAPGNRCVNPEKDSGKPLWEAPDIEPSGSVEITFEVRDERGSIHG